MIWALRKLLESRRIHKTKAGGNCYCRAISYALAGSEDSHELIQQKIVYHISNDINEKLKHDINQSVNAYLRESSMNSYGTWATDVDMLLLLYQPCSSVNSGCPGPESSILVSFRWACPISSHVTDY